MDTNKEAAISHQSETEKFFVRPRVLALLTQAAKNPLVAVCARAGYGKTQAVSDFVQESKVPALWVQLSQKDNIPSRFWVNFLRAGELILKPVAEEIEELGFPDTDDKLRQHFHLLRPALLPQRFFIVFDDVHLIDNPAVLRFIGGFLHDDTPKNRTVFLICHELPQISIPGPLVRGLVSNIGEEALNFTENELAQYLYQCELPMNPRTLQEIYQDTKGWASAVRFIALALKNAPGYAGYVRSAMKNNIFQLLEMEVWEKISQGLRRLLVCLSLVDHFSADLIALLAKGNSSLLAELERQRAYIRLDRYTSAYLIHNLFLDFLRTKQGIITGAEKRETYQTAADWCLQNGFRVDAFAYYEKLGDYEAIGTIFAGYSNQLPEDIARFMMEIFDRTSADVFGQVICFSAAHLRSVICLGLWAKALELAKHYETRCLQLPEDDVRRNRSLACLYHNWAILRAVMSIEDGRYDFDEYFAKMNACMAKLPVELRFLPAITNGPWVAAIGSARKGAPLEYIEAAINGARQMTHCGSIGLIGRTDVEQGELMFYQGNTHGAELFFILGLERCREGKEFDTAHRALYYIMRVAVAHGNYPKAEQALKDMEALTEENGYEHRFITYDIALGWYCCALRQPERAPDWLKQKFAPYVHACSIDNFGNQVKARYCYLTKNYAPLLAYIDESRRREAVLYGRVEGLAAKACAHFQVKDRPAAFAALREAYETASPNGIIMPFIELGKDMRTLLAAAAREKGNAIPQLWLETMGRKSTTYAKRQALFISGHKKANGISEAVTLSSRENEVLRDLYNGLSRSEIAVNQGVSINAVKLIVNSIYEKLEARNIADIIRTAVERKLV